MVKPEDEILERKNSFKIGQCILEKDKKHDVMMLSRDDTHRYILSQSREED